MKDLTKELEQLNRRLEKHSEKPEALQADVIRIGEALEKHGYEGTAVIKSLETIAEILYWYASGMCDEAKYRQLMNYQTKYLLDTFFWCVPEGSHRFSVSAILKNEPDLLEWIAYHKLMGVDHFYLFDNGSTNGMKETVAPLAERGLVTYIDYPGKAMQDRASNYAIEHFRFETKWLAIIDGDEYLVPMEEGILLPELFDDIIDRYKKSPFQTGGFPGAVGVNWRDYGTSGHKEPQEGLVIENYLYRGEDDYVQNCHIKTVMNPRTALDMNNPHSARFRDGYYCISEHGSFLMFSYFFDSQCKRIRINHYFSKSEQQLLEKNRRGWPVGDLVRDDEKELHEAAVECNKVYDPVLLRYADAVRRELEAMKK